jgi:lipopolysaccharide export LptBFGC system permease protein LptF
MEIVIADCGHLQKLYESDYIYRFIPGDIRFVVIGYLLHKLERDRSLNRLMVRSLETKGYLDIVNLDEQQNRKAVEIYQNKAQVIFESIAAMVYAEENKMTFMSEDFQVMEYAYKNFNLPDVISSKALDKSLRDILLRRDEKFKEASLTQVPDERRVDRHQRHKLLSK